MRLSKKWISNFKKLFMFTLFSALVLSCEKKEKINKNSLNLNISHDVVTFDPRKGGDFTSSTLQFLLFEGLTKMTPYSLVSPALAETIDISEDRLVYTFHLRDAKWSNGHLISAHDFVETWKDMLAPNFPCPNAHLLYPIKNAEKAKRGKIPIRYVGIKALDHRTIEIKLERPTPYFLEMISFCVFFPIHQSTAVRNPKWAEIENKELVCNGPYRIEKYKPGNEIILEKNPHYWDKSNVTLEKIHISIIDNEMTAMKLYENDELDILGLPFTGIPSDYIPNLMDRGVLKTSHLPASTICCFNMDVFPFSNVHIRKAFAYAINRSEIIDNLTSMQNETGLNLIPSILMPQEGEPFFKDGDVELAKTHLQKGLKELAITEDELGPITLLHASSGSFAKIATALQYQWRKALGIEVELCSNEYNVFLDKLTKRNYMMAECVWIAQYPDPMNFFERFKEKKNPKNYPGYENPEYVKLIELSILESDNDKRFKILKEAEKLLSDEMPLTSLYHWKNTYLQKPNVKDLQIYPTGSFHLQEIYFENDELKD
jgi:oligopeptide transport system substrate-binding protein